MKKTKIIVFMLSVLMICLTFFTSCNQEDVSDTGQSPGQENFLDLNEGLGDSKTCSHNYVGKITTIPTCTSQGVKTFTCSKCGMNYTEAVASNDHQWLDATCTTAKTCSVCKVTEGKELGHSWNEATCTTAKTCSVCKVIEGKELGHSWNEATCTTAKTCSMCLETDGDAMGHSWNNYVCSQCKISNKIIVSKTTATQSFEAYSESEVLITLPTIIRSYRILDSSGNNVGYGNLGYSQSTSNIKKNLEKGSYTLIFYYYLDVTTKMQSVRGPDGSYSYQYVTTGAGSEYTGTCLITIN